MGVQERIRREVPARYREIFDDIELTNEKISWNAGAFLGGPIWFAYHRLYWQAVILAAVSYGVRLCASLFPPLGGLANYWALQAALAGCFGNWILYKHLSRGRPFATDKITPVALFALGLLISLWAHNT